MTLAEFRKLTHRMDETTILAVRVGVHPMVEVVGVAELLAARAVTDRDANGWASFDPVADPILVLKVGVRHADPRN